MNRTFKNNLTREIVKIIIQNEINSLPKKNKKLFKN